MSEKFFIKIYPRIIREIKKRAIVRYSGRKGFLTVEDYIQIGLCGILDMNETRSLNTYISRAISRMIDYDRYWSRRERKENELIRIMKMNGGTWN